MPYKLNCQSSENKTRRKEENVDWKKKEKLIGNKVLQNKKKLYVERLS
jgi:hypothetical protein